VSRREGASFGCLGWLWLLAMALGTLLLAIALVWLDPAWLARVAFWKTPALPQETILVPISQEEAEVLEGGGTSREPGTRVWEAERVTARYSEAEGATLTTVEGTRVELPPGSMAGEHSIELTPVIESARSTTCGWTGRSTRASIGRFG